MISPLKKRECGPVARVIHANSSSHIWIYRSVSVCELSNSLTAKLGVTEHCNILLSIQKRGTSQKLNKGRAKSLVTSEKRATGVESQENKPAFKQRCLSLSVHQFYLILLTGDISDLTSDDALLSVKLLAPGISSYFCPLEECFLARYGVCWDSVPPLTKRAEYEFDLFQRLDM